MVIDIDHQLIIITGLSRSTIYLRMAEGKFPQQISLGSRAVGWINSEVIDWIEHRISESRGVVLKKD